jgi:hypothetical protein
MREAREEQGPSGHTGVPLDARRGHCPALKVEVPPMHEADTDKLAYKRAHKRVKELRDFYMHLLVYLVVILGLFLIDLLTPGGPWFYWPLVGWGIAVVLHAASLVFEGSVFGAGWEERKTRQLMERERSRRPPRPPQPLAP